MMDFIAIPLVTGIITLGIYKLFELFVRRKERLLIIDKIGDRLEPASIDSKISFPLQFEKKSGFGTLKLACLFLGTGLGLLVGFFICFCLMPEYNTEKSFYFYGETSNIIYGASVMFFGGLGLLVAFLTEFKHSKSECK